MADIKEIKRDYDSEYFYGKLGGPGYTHEWILNLLEVKPDRTLLDIGCGQGLLLEEAHKRRLETFGIDISREAATRARENASYSEIICDNAKKLPWENNHFDYITNIGSLEHFLNPEACLKEMRRTLKPSGKAIIMLPNLYFYGYLMDKFFKRKSPTSYQTVERFAKRKVWQKFLEDNGFKVIKVYKYNKFNKSKWLLLLRKILIPLEYSHHFVFACRKK